MFRKLAKRVLGPKLGNAKFLFAAPLAYPPGHFYSPICDPDEVARRYRDPLTVATSVELPGIQLNREAQRALWEQWRPYLSEARGLAENRKGCRYRVPSRSFGVGDAIIYSCMLRHLQPKRLIEIGSGSSSAVALDTFDTFFAGWPRISFIEPYPKLLNSLLTPPDRPRVEIIETGVQDVPPEYFDTLASGDVLFIDSTHIVKTGSDVVYELFEILPRLQPGVVVHFHDVFFPFEYPRQWALAQNYSWNEQYTLRAFLTGNRDWEILFFNDHFVRSEHSLIERDAPELLREPGAASGSAAAFD